MRLWSCLPVLLVSVPLLAKAKKPTGEIPDPKAFAKIGSYCVNTSQLRGDEEYDVRGFMATESKPRQLLTKLPWKLFPDCREGNPDAVIRIEFPLLRTLGIRLGEPARPGQEPENAYNIKAVLQISDSSTSAILYRAEAMPLEGRDASSPESTEDPPSVLRHKALYGAFSTLIDDVRRVSGSGR